MNTTPDELPVGEKSYQKITRGHLASNVELKSLGDPEEGLQAQKDSFSLANVVPQMQRHNAPIWAKLEDECMEAARRLGTTVGVISGPVYAPDVALPVPGNEVLFTAGRDGVAIPIPTHFFNVVLAKMRSPSGERFSMLSSVGLAPLEPEEAPQLSELSLLCGLRTQILKT